MPEFADRLATDLAEMCDPLAVLLFGSWAHGRADQNSDLDLVLVLHQRASPLLRAALFDALRTVPMKVDLLLWSPRDLAAARADPHSFAGSLLSGAIPLYGDLPPPPAQVYHDCTERT